MPPQFEQKQIEHDIERLRRELEEKQRQLQHAAEQKEDKEVLHETIAERIQKPAAVREAPPSSAPAPPASSDDDNLPGYLRDVDEGIRHEVRSLVHFAFEHGIDKAVSEAKKHDAFVLDAFHDALVEKLYEELKRRGVL